MIDAFEKGGCFHSRTAMGMYPSIKEAVEKGEVLLEWDSSKGKPTLPLVKDKYASERRKAKTLNFSIAYGKTIHGLAKDWGISLEEAKETLDAWYRDRPEVKEWQDRTRKNAQQDLYVRTMMGRYRNLPDAASRGPAGSHSLRAAINTPIQVISLSFSIIHSVGKCS
jgi:DNA polymerase-1